MAIESQAIYKDMLIVLGTAGVAIPLLRRIGLSSNLGFLLTGVFLGPHVLGWLAQQIPVLSPLELREGGGISGVAELGVVFLLFLIGLELSPERLRTMRQLVVGLGGTQIALSAAALAALAWAWGYGASQAAVIGLALSLSSTAIVIQHFSEEKRLGSQAGRMSFAVLLMQDLCVVPMLLLVGTLAPAPGGGNVAMNIGMALAQALAAGAFIVIAGRFVLTPLLRMVAGANSADLFMATVLFIIIGTAALAAGAGLSMSLGAFIAGLTLAETEFRRAIEAIIEPFKGILLGLFFLLVGLSLNVGLLVQQPLLVLALTALIIAVKSLLILAIAWAMKLPRAPALECALLLGPGGEFAFVLFGVAAAAGLFAADEIATLLLAVTLSMMIIPLLGRFARMARRGLPAPGAAAGYQLPEAGIEGPNVIIAGFGRVGRIVADMLKEQDLPLVGIDLDAGNLAAARKVGHPVYFGDAADIAFLRRCGLARARALAITMDNPSRAHEILKAARADRPDLKIIARARDERHAMKLYEAGVTEAVPETTEASLQLAEALLVETGVPMGLAIAAVHERRDSYRKLLGRPNRKEEVARMRSRLKRRMQTNVD